MAREIFDGFDFVSRPTVPFLWMGLPEPWLSGTFKAAAYESGILIDDEDEFKAGRVDQIYHRVRIAFSSPADRNVVENCFLTLRRLLENEQAGYEGVSDGLGLALSLSIYDWAGKAVFSCRTS